MSSDLEVALSEVAGLLEQVGAVCGVSPACTVLRVSGVVVRGASGVARVIEAAELERIRQSAALGTAAGLAAYEASRQTFKR